MEAGDFAKSRRTSLEAESAVGLHGDNVVQAWEAGPKLVNWWVAASRRVCCFELSSPAVLRYETASTNRQIGCQSAIRFNSHGRNNRHRENRH